MMDRKLLIEIFAKELAEKQKKADIFYYEYNDKEMSSFLLDGALVIKQLAVKLKICEEVYERAYEIYDFRNSGKSGYILKGGEIVRENC